MILKNLCNTCKKTFNNCNGDLEDIIFAGDLFILPDITVTQLDYVIECNGYKGDSINMTKSINICNQIITKLKEVK